MAEIPETERELKAFGWAARDKSGIFSPFMFSRRAIGELDVQFKVMYCGICHSDLHMAKNEWGSTKYPIVPGHEITGIVTEVGTNVKKFKVGDKVGLGCLIGSCRECTQCTNDLENHCVQTIQTYGVPYTVGIAIYGGYSNIMVADEHSLFRWPEHLPLDAGAPLLCAGITTYSPLRYFGLDKPGLSVGVVGLGGLGHLAVKFAQSFGTKVTVISTSKGKKKEAMEKLGADEFLLGTDPEQLKDAEGSLDGIIDTVSGVHPLLPLLSLLKPHGRLILVGAAEGPVDLHVFPMIVGRKSISGSSGGGLKETQEMIDYAAKHKIWPNVEVIPIDYINTAMERLAKSDVKYRFVIDVAKLMKPE